MASESSLNDFGHVIAYLVPGFLLIVSIGPIDPKLQRLLALPATEQPTLGGFLYITIASLAVGLLASTVRWLLIDSLHHVTGLRRPQWDFSNLHLTGPGYDRLNALH